jgi:hypothetical protein
MTPLCTLSTWFPSQRHYVSVATLPHKVSLLKYLVADESLDFRMCFFVNRWLKPALSTMSQLCMLSLCSTATNVGDKRKYLDSYSVMSRQLTSMVG